jgi:hypothetical protein
MKKNILLLAILIIIGGIAWYLINNSSSSSLSSKPLADFAIEDTASINKIIITDQFGEIAKVERVPGQKLWRLNDKYPARTDVIDLILATIKRIRIRGNVSEKAEENMMKLIVTNSKRVEIFQGGEMPAKIFYVGIPTPDHTGTHMLLEIPGIGRSSEPYITHMDGFSGFLTTRFFTDENEWRFTGVFNYPELDIQTISVENYIDPSSSLAVEYKGGNDIRLFDGFNMSTKTFGNEIPMFDTIAIKNFILLFKKMHVESYNTGLTPQSQDSLRNIPPSYRISVIDNQGNTNNIQLYRRKSNKDYLDENGNPKIWDVGHFWGLVNNKDFALAQTYTFDPVIQPLNLYFKK